jgi:hypothetical protein
MKNNWRKPGQTDGHVFTASHNNKFAAGFCGFEFEGLRGAGCCE